MHLPFLHCACNDLLGFMVEEMPGVAFAVGIPCGFAYPTFAPIAAHSPVNFPSRSTLGIILMAFRKGTRKTVSESMHHVCYMRHSLPLGVSPSALLHAWGNYINSIALGTAI
ncbi:hypothetical protein EDB86DRAFT_2824907 [Lactarius hatsudake]|nr:hypothetical protein EDB86DRAFT_2824907 [Lactarius hatsudake]